MLHSDEEVRKLPEVLGTVAKAPVRLREAGRLEFLLTDLVKLPEGRWLKIECWTDKECNCVRGWLSQKSANYSMRSQSPLAGKKITTTKFGTVLYVKIDSKPKGAIRSSGV